MVFAWSVAEVIRYSFYAFSLAGFSPYVLLWLRYTAFYILYPLGASSEASLICASLPTSSIPGWRSWLQGMWKPTDYVRAALFMIWWPGTYSGPYFGRFLTLFHSIRSLHHVYLHGQPTPQSSGLKLQVQNELIYHSSFNTISLACF